VNEYFPTPAHTLDGFKTDLKYEKNKPVEVRARGRSKKISDVPTSGKRYFYSHMIY
jgi:hypothetical protein